jgi:hypothetical protein
MSLKVDKIKFRVVNLYIIILKNKSLYFNFLGIM